MDAVELLRNMKCPLLCFLIQVGMKWKHKQKQSSGMQHLGICCAWKPKTRSKFELFRSLCYFPVLLLSWLVTLLVATISRVVTMLVTTISTCWTLVSQNTLLHEVNPAITLASCVQYCM